MAYFTENPSFLRVDDTYSGGTPMTQGVPPVMESIAITVDLCTSWGPCHPDQQLSTLGGARDPSVEDPFGSELHWAGRAVSIVMGYPP